MTSPYAKTSAAMLTKNANTGRLSEAKRKPPAKLTRKVADDLADSGDTPLDVMLENMWFWRNQAENLHAILMERIGELHPVDGVVTADDRAKIQEKWQKTLEQVQEIGQHFLEARKNSQQCAVDAAPYVNAKIAATKLKGATDAAAKLIEKQTSPQDAMAAYLDSLKIVDIVANEPDAGEAAEEVAS